MTQPYLFGFTSQLTKISFPQGLFLVIECASQAAGTYGEMGEPFELFPPAGLLPRLLPSALGGGVNPQSPVQGIDPRYPIVLLSPYDPSKRIQQPPNPTWPILWKSPPPLLLTGVTGPAGFNPITTPVILPVGAQVINPASKQMLSNEFSWIAPEPPYIQSGISSSTAAGVMIFNLTAIQKLLKSSTFTFNIATLGHGTGSTPPAPTGTWFIYFDPLNIDVINAAIINATGNINTQSFLDITDNINPPNYNISDRTVAADPFAVASYGSTINSVCSMYSYYFASGGFPAGAAPMGFSTQVEAEAALAYYNRLSGPPPYPEFVGWPDVSPYYLIPGGAEAIFGPWMSVPSPYPGQATCSWQISASLWKKQNLTYPKGTPADQQTGFSFPVSQQGVFTPVGSPLQVSAVTSNGSNPRSCSNIITVNMAKRTFSLTQKFS